MNRSLPAALLLWGGIGCHVLAAAPAMPQAIALNNLGAAEYSRGRYVQAQSLLDKSVSLYRAAGGDSLDFSTALLNLAANERARAHYAQAEGLYKECLQMRQGISRGLAPPLDGLAGIYMSQGDLARAEELGRRAVKAADQANDSANELLSSLTHLALVLSARGEYTEAEGLAARAQVLATALFGAVSREHADVSNVLAMIAKSRSQLAYAEIRSRQAVEMYETTAGPDHPLTLLAKKNLAGILGAQGKYKPARALLTEALGTLEKLDGAEHPDVISTVRDFAVLEFAQKHYGQAAELYRRVFETDMRTFGASNPRTRFDLNDLGSTEFARHRLHEAEELFIRAMTSERTGDARDSIVKANLAQVYQVQKRYEEAASLYREALEEFERSGRAQDPRLGSILASYASLLRVTGDYAQAEKLQARATALQVRGILGREGHAS